MKNYVLLLIALLLSLSSIAQVSFEKGYIINSTGEKLSCLIKNEDWVNTPSKFEYKISENKEVKDGDIQNVKTVEIENHSKYQNFSVEIDRSSESLDKMTLEKSLNSKEEQLFLKVLVEGEVSLYEYRKGGLNRFFIKKDDEKIKQLVYKKI